MNGLSNPYSSNRFSILILRQASFDKLRTEQGERIEKRASDKLSSSSSGQAGRTDWKGGFRKPQEIKNGLRTSFLSSALFLDLRGECVESSTTPISVRAEPVEV
jgi:hypothetical protein